MNMVSVVLVESVGVEYKYNFNKNIVSNTQSANLYFTSGYLFNTCNFNVCTCTVYV